MFCDQIARERKRMGLGRQEVARRSHCSVPTVYSVEAGTGTISSLLRVTDALGASIIWSGCTSSDPLGVSLASARHAMGMSQRTMAAMIGVTQPTVVALERHSKGRMVVLERYCRAIGINVDILSKDATPVIKGRKLVPSRNRPESDVVFTPRTLAKAVIDHHPISGQVLDPCRGDGAFYDQFPDHSESLWCEINEGRDFLQWQMPVDWIVGNPPWSSRFRDFLVHSMEISNNVLFLASLTHFTTKARIADIGRHGFSVRSILLVPAVPEWRHSGFQLAAVRLQKNWAGRCWINHLDGVPIPAKRDCVE